jgi:hypothetical protein
MTVAGAGFAALCAWLCAYALWQVARVRWPRLRRTKTSPDVSEFVGGDGGIDFPAASGPAGGRSSAPEPDADSRAEGER